MTTVEAKIWRRPQKGIDPFMFFVLLSFLIHGLGVVGFVFWNRSLPSKPKKRDYTPIEFVVPPPQEKPEKTPKTNRRAVTNSVAKGTVKPKVTPATKKLGENTPRAARSVRKKPKPKVRQPRPMAKTPSVPPKRQSRPPLKPTPVKDKKPPRETKPVKPVKPLPTAVSKPKLPPRVATRSPLKPKPPAQPIPRPTESPAVSRNKPVKPIAPTRPVPPKPPAASGPASQLGGNYARGRDVGENPGSSIVNPQASANRQARNQQINARRVDLGPYLAELRRRVKRNWKPSNPTNNRYTVLAFTIHRSGRITGLRVVQSSGSKLVDKEAIQAIQRATPFAPLPKNYPNDRFSLDFSFNIYVY